MSGLAWLALGEGSLIVTALVWAWLRGIALPFRLDLPSFGLALVATGGFVGVNFGLYRFGKAWRRLSDVYAFIDNELIPLFGGAPYSVLFFLAVLAGVGEELFFRGVLQQEIGLGWASLIFGFLHGPVRELFPLGVWAACMGGVLGLLYEHSGNVVVPAMAHALYDGAALVYLSRRAE